MRSAVVRLDDPRYGAGPGTVIALVDTVGEYLAIARANPDGAHDRSLRMWRAYAGANVGDRVRAAQTFEERATYGGAP